MYAQGWITEEMLHLISISLPRLWHEYTHKFPKDSNEGGTFGTHHRFKVERLSVKISQHSVFHGNNIDQRIYFLPSESVNIMTEQLQ